MSYRTGQSPDWAMGPDPDVDDDAEDADEPGHCEGVFCCGDGECGCDCAPCVRLNEAADPWGDDEHDPDDYEEEE